MTPAERASMHALLDEALASEPGISGIVVLVEIDVYPGEIKIASMLGERAVRLRQILAKIRKR